MFWSSLVCLIVTKKKVMEKRKKTHKGVVESRNLDVNAGHFEQIQNY